MSVEVKFFLKLNGISTDPAFRPLVKKGSPTWGRARARKRKRAKEKEMVKAKSKKQRFKRAFMQEVMRLRRMGRRMERMKTRMRKEQRGSCQVKRNGEERKSRNDEREVQTPFVGAQVLFHLCYLISHMFSVREIFYNWIISPES